ncbi:MAG TPA: M23 family metallopeptidase [candidate division WOR-3 bacterium]|uniref:M23 family metallopeptidase n=1 Tax=candidate division WOR-3 bacterium TaxID=2052148 RepID=A0A7V0T5G2_UNCW3|nr:M23 family metallopeptidase [candidate division WOR-3 bacterium]
MTGKRQVSFLVTTNYNSRSHRGTLSLAAVRLAGVIAALLLVLVVFALVLGWAGLHRTARLSYLETRNVQLEAEFVRVAELRQRLDRLEELERRYAEMLGVELTPPPVDWSVLPGDRDDIEDAAPDAWGSAPVPSLRPVEEFVVSRRFSRDHPGVDLAARAGTPVRASADGVVAEASEDSIFGHHLRLTHPGGFETFYGHLRERQAAVGDSVRAGQPIGTVGSTGRSTAPHLHFEVRRYGEPVDPAELMVLR